MTDTFEEQYQDVLQNIEFAIVNVARANPELIDYDVERAVDHLSRHYSAEVRNRTVTLPQLNEDRQQIFDSIQAMCELRLGRAEMTSEGGEALSMEATITVEEIVACLKRIRKSIKRWSKQGGRQGYLTFVDQFIT